METMHNPKLTTLSKNLRNNMTKEEKRLWYDFLKKLNVNFKRQKIIGNYIVDFYCPSARMVIELDGSQHNEAENKANDRERDKYLADHGIAVFRYSNRDINKNFGGVCTHITHRLEELLGEDKKV